MNLNFDPSGFNSRNLDYGMFIVAIVFGLIAAVGFILIMNTRSARSDFKARRRRMIAAVLMLLPGFLLTCAIIGISSAVPTTQAQLAAFQHGVQTTYGVTLNQDTAVALLTGGVTNEHDRHGGNHDTNNPHLTVPTYGSTSILTDGRITTVTLYRLDGRYVLAANSNSQIIPLPTR